MLCIQMIVALVSLDRASYNCISCSAFTQPKQINATPSIRKNTKKSIIPSVEAKPSRPHLTKKMNALRTEHPPTHLLNTLSERILSSSLKVASGIPSLFIRITTRSASSWLLANVRGSHPEFAGNVSLDPYAEIVQQSFRNSTFYPLATGLSGTLSTAGVQAYGPIASGLSWQSRVAFAHANDQSAFDSYNSFAADIWLPWLVSWGGMRPWTIVPTAGVTTWRYGAPDPFVAPFTTAHITEWRVGLGLEVPIWRQLAIGSLLQYRNGTSNVAAFSYRDLSISAGPLIRF